MMRSMYAAVSGLKTHQSKMDVIGNNIANVNTVAFKSSSVTFQDLLYQTTAGASGPNAATGVGGINARQIGLGVTTGAISVNITSSGAAETTGNPFDVRLTDKSSTNFFIVNNGSENVFTRAGSFYVDGSGNLCMSSTGYTVMGWQADPTTGNINKNTVTALRIMSAENLTSPPEATTNAISTGIIDKKDTDPQGDTGLVQSLTFFDNLGYQYTAKFAVKETGDGAYTVELSNIIDSTGSTVWTAEGKTAAQIASMYGIARTGVELARYTTVKSGYFLDAATGKIHVGTDNTGPELIPAADVEDGFTVAGGAIHSLKDVYGVSDSYLNRLTAGTATGAIDATTGALTITGDTANHVLNFSTADGTFNSINGMDSVTLNMSQLGANFANISIDYSKLTNVNNGGKTTASMESGAQDGTTGKGKKVGTMNGLSIDNNGKIWGSYTNGNTVVLGQMAVAQFANASGLEKIGENCYTTTLNSGEFDGVGIEISADGSSMTAGELEMSNVDLSSEFTSMIVTQRGFQANSRVITTSDTLLEELVNLKR